MTYRAKLIDFARDSADHNIKCAKNYFSVIFVTEMSQIFTEIISNRNHRDETILACSQQPSGRPSMKSVRVAAALSSSALPVLAAVVPVTLCCISGAPRKETSVTL